MQEKKSDLSNSSSSCSSLQRIQLKRRIGDSSRLPMTEHFDKLYEQSFEPRLSLSNTPPPSRKKSQKWWSDMEIIEISWSMTMAFLFFLKRVM